jgi:glycosyltransferase involved in cell wall biosynthesis
MSAFKFLFVSSNADWGGSEYLWARTASVLQSLGHRCSAFVNYDAAGLRRIMPAGIIPFKLRIPPGLSGSKINLDLDRVWRGSVRRMQPPRIAFHLKTHAKPDLAVISQGSNYDGAGIACACIRRGIPFVLIAHKANEQHWIPDRWFSQSQEAYAKAARCFFVSERTRQVTELQLAQPVPRSEVVRNPFLVPWDDPSPWPSEDKGYEFASVARLLPLEKGQDILLSMMAETRWRERPVRLTFYGSGPCQQSLRAAASFLGLRNVAFAGETDDVASIWKNNHLFLMPSRAEGLPIALVEAMLSNRVPVVTPLAAEMVEDNQSGFISSGASFSETMERAWANRDRWPKIGIAAGDRARSLIPAEPESVMAERLLAVAAQSKAAMAEFAKPPVSVPKTA